VQVFPAGTILPGGNSPPGRAGQRPCRADRGGDRRANAALYRIALTRSRCDQRTRDYLDKRAAQGMTRREAIRCIKRYIAREVYQLIQQLNPAGHTLRTA
jgi:hypothetical protein